MRLFPFFLWATFVIQIGGFLYSHITRKSNHFIFNSYIFIEYGFYLFVFSKSVRSDMSKRILQGVLLAFVLFFILDVIIIGNFFVYNTVAKNIAEFITFCCCIYYFLELLFAKEYLNYFAIPMFWITTGIMLSAIGDFLYSSFFDYILQNNLDPDGKIYGIISTSLSIIEYGLFTVGFCCNKVWTKAN